MRFVALLGLVDGWGLWVLVSKDDVTLGRQFMVSLVRNRSALTPPFVL